MYCMPISFCFCFRYGDRIPLTYGGRFLTFMWMLSGTVIFTLLVSYISSGLTVASLENNIKLYGSKVRDFNRVCQETFHLVRSIILRIPLSKTESRKIIWRFLASRIIGKFFARSRKNQGDPSFIRLMRSECVQRQKFDSIVAYYVSIAHKSFICSKLNHRVNIKDVNLL